MCHPAVVIAMTVASTAMAAKGQMEAGKAAQAQAQYQAALARNNQIIADRAAEDALKRGEIAEQNQRQKTGLLIGAQVNELAAQGFTLDEGTPLDILGDTAAAGELDALTIRSNAAREAYNFRAQGMNYQAEGQLDLLRGSAARSAANINTASTLLSGAGSFASQYNQFYVPKPK